MTFLFCRVTSRDHIIKKICDLISGSHSIQVNAVPSLMIIALAEREI